MRKSDPCSRHDRKRAREAQEARERLRGITLEEPSREQIAEAVGLGLIAYEKMLHRLESGKQNSVHNYTHDQDAGDEISLLPSKNDSPFDTYSRKQDFRILKSHIDELTPRHREILQLYYFKDLGLKEIGERLSVGEARICQLHKQALTELRRRIERKSVSAPTTSELIQ